MKHLFIVNPVAGGRDRTNEVRAEVLRAFSGRDDEYEIYTTQKVMDACEKVRQEASAGKKLWVYACGGDGTLNECVNGVYGFDNTAVTHYPTGTGNDFVKMFGEEKSCFYDLNQLLDGEERSIDVMDCNGRLCVNICSVGIDARIGTEVHKYSSLPLIRGSGAYMVSAVANLFKGVNREMEITCEGRVFSGKHALVCACNGRFYGGAFNPVATAMPHDGIIEFLVVKQVSRPMFLRLVGKYAVGRFSECPDHITHIRGGSLSIRCKDEEVINIDGEAIYDKNINLQVIPGGIRFVFPRSMEFFQKSEAEVGAISQI